MVYNPNVSVSKQVKDYLETLPIGTKVTEKTISQATGIPRGKGIWNMLLRLNKGLYMTVESQEDGPQIFTLIKPVGDINVRNKPGRGNSTQTKARKAEKMKVQLSDVLKEFTGDTLPARTTNGDLETRVAELEEQNRSLLTENERLRMENYSFQAVIIRLGSTL